MTIVVKDNDVQIEKLELGPFGTNSYIVVCQSTKESLVVDAPGDTPKVLERLKGTDPKYIVITHDHWDHLGSFTQLRSELNVPVAVHPADSGNLPSAPEVLLHDGDFITLGNIKFKVLHTPGHTPGSICFLFGKYLISGDTLFPGGPGKTSSPSTFHQIVESITSKIFTLPDDTQVFPGHGDSTVLKKEKQEYKSFSSRPRKPNLCGDVLWLSS
ncbi:MAG: MBL fold metallo-hydrolase [Thermodesulfobacteriota bacterium]|nr:MBL fold metallo-hydrolase [Thermodesulfobacteriota bacterium]